MAMLLLALGRGIHKNMQQDSRNNPSNTQQDTIHYTPSPYNSEYAAPTPANRTTAPRDEPPPPYTRVAPPELQLPQPQAEPQPRIPSRTQSQSQPRQAQASQAQLPSRTQSQSQPQRSANSQYPTPPAYQNTPPRTPSEYVIVDAAGSGVCDCVYRDGFGLAPKCRKCQTQMRRGQSHSGRGERRRRRREGPGPIQMLVAEARR